MSERFRALGREDLIPPTESFSTLSQKTVQELKELHPKRYEIYVKWLRDAQYMSEEEKKQMNRWVRIMNALDEFSFYAREDDEATLRSQQKDVFDAIRRHVESGKRKGYIHLPTGVGKTVLFVE